jgi:hypothetical protein
MVTRLLTGAMLACLAVAACSSEVTGPDVGLPNRTQAADVSRVTREFRQVGGNAFVRLTGFPTPQSIDALARAGLKPPADCERVWGTPCTTIMKFDGLALHAVSGNIPPHGVDRLVALKFVTAIEPSADDIHAMAEVASSKP